MRNVAGVALGTSALFLIVVAVMINSQALFYMSTAMIATIFAARLQAYLAVRGLRFERSVPPAATVGDLVSVEIAVWSERRMRRPLVQIFENFPARLVMKDLTPSLPVAPAIEQPVYSRYAFRPLRRGRYRWDKLTVYGTDALGLVTMTREYRSEPAEITVYPASIPVSINVLPAAGSLTSEGEIGRRRGSGIEPRGVREYTDGDPLRHVHWASSARLGRLMVKEFETGSGLFGAFLIQRTSGTEIGTGAETTLEAMCGHATYLSELILRQGGVALFPVQEQAADIAQHQTIRKAQIAEILATVQADQNSTISGELESVQEALPAGAAVYVMISVQDPSLPATLAAIPGLARYVLAYDADEYRQASRGTRPSGSKISQSAAEGAYVARLRDAGAQVVLMPKVGAVV